MSGSVHSPVDIHLYDAQGRHVGKNDVGGIDEQIPEAEYIEIPDLHEKSITVHGGDGTEGYRFVLKGSGTGTFDFTLSSPDPVHNSAVIAKHLAVPVTTSTEASVLLDVNKDYALQIDNDGDGAVDEQRQPDSVVTQAVDLTPPAQTTDLSVTNISSGAASQAVPYWMFLKRNFSDTRKSNVALVISMQFLILFGFWVFILVLSLLQASQLNT